MFLPVDITPVSCPEFTFNKGTIAARQYFAECILTERAYAQYAQHVNVPKIVSSLIYEGEGPINREGLAIAAKFIKADYAIIPNLIASEIESLRSWEAYRPGIIGVNAIPVGVPSGYDKYSVLSCAHQMLKTTNVIGLSKQLIRRGVYRRWLIEALLNSHPNVEIMLLGDGGDLYTLQDFDDINFMLVTARHIWQNFKVKCARRPDGYLDMHRDVFYAMVK